MDEISKLPWSRDRYGHLVDANGKGVSVRRATNLMSGTPKEIAQAKANDDFMLQAANAFPALKALLARAIRIADDIDCVPYEMVQAFITDAKAALAQAEVK